MRRRGRSDERGAEKKEKGEWRREGGRRKGEKGERTTLYKIPASGKLETGRDKWETLKFLEILEREDF